VCSPDLVRGAFATTWIYVAGPLLGALIAVGFEWILKGPATPEGTRTAQGTSDENSDFFTMPNGWSELSR
jgi:aquaporin Z